MRIAKDLIMGLKIKLKMFDVPLMKLANHFCDNKVVAKKMSIPQQTLPKKHISINNHVIRKFVTAGIMSVARWKLFPSWLTHNQGWYLSPESRST